MLKSDIRDALKAALKKGDTNACSTLRMLSAAIITREKEKRYKISKSDTSLSDAQLSKKSELNDEEVIEIVSSEIKKRKEAILIYEKGNRSELAQKEMDEMEVLKKYLPEQISEEELKKIIKEAIDKTGAREIKDMGKVMAEIMPKTKGRTDGSEVGRIAREFLIKQ